MKTTKPVILAALLPGALMLWATSSEAALCTSLSSGNWNVAARWSCGNVPGAGDTAIIANPHTVTVNANTTVDAVTVNAGGTLNIPNRNFTVNGATNISGTINHTDTGGSENYDGLVTINPGGVWNNAVGENITFRGGITHNGATFNTGGGRMDFRTNNQTISGASPLTFSGADAIRIRGGITVTNNANVTILTGLLYGDNAASTWVNGVNSTLNYANATAPMTSGTIGVFTASAAGNTVNYNGAAQNVRLPTGSTYYHLTLSGSGAKTLPGAMTVSGNFTMSGTASTTAVGALTVGGGFTIGAGTTFTASTFSHSVAGNFSNSGTFTANTSRFTFNGTVAQSITGATTFYNVTMNNAAGLAINNNVTVSNVLTLTSGVISTGSNTLITSANCNAPAVSRTSGHVAGNLQKRIPLGAPVSCTFEIGDATTYRPINTTFASVGTAGNVTGWSSQSAGDHPDTTNLLSGVDPLLSVNRYWTLTNSGTGFTTCNATFNYVAGDIDVGPPAANPASFIIALGSSCSGSGATRTCTSWTQPTVGALGATSTQATGLAAFGDFAVGELKDPNFSREPQFIYTRELY